MRQENIGVVNEKSILGRFFGSTRKMSRGLLPIIGTAGLLFGACNSPDDSSPSPIKQPPISEEPIPDTPIRILPLDGPVYLTQGIHAWDDSENGVKSSLDFAPKRVTGCPAGERVSIDEQDVIATTSGTITVVGDPDNRKDPKHSIVEITEDGTGLRFEEFHIDDIPEKIKVGIHINRGDPIGKVSCEVPAGGRTTGAHIHEDVMDKDGNYIPINGLVFSGYTVNGDTMTKPDGTIKTADIRRCDNDQLCDGIRNDLKPNKNIPTPTPTQVLTPTEKAPSATPATSQETENMWQTFTSTRYNYQLKFPNNWNTNNGQFQMGSNDIIEYFNGPVIDNAQESIGIVGQDIDGSFDLNQYIDRLDGAIIEQGQIQDNDKKGLKDLTNIKIAGNDTTFVYQTINNSPDQASYIKITAIFVAKGKIWNADLWYGRDFTTENEQNILDIYSHVLNSFRFLN